MRACPFLFAYNTFTTCLYNSVSFLGTHMQLTSVPINDAILQIHNSWAISLAIGGTILSIAFFNFSGISVTKEMSATTRMVLDSVRTIVIWAYGLIGTPAGRPAARGGALTFALSP